MSFAGSIIAWGKLNGKIKDFSFNGQHIINLLLLTSPIFMLQVYDRVLTSRSIQTLVALLGLATLLLASMGIILIHTVEIWMYAFLYLALGTLHDFETALYFSTVTYASVGYGDVLLPKGWRILGAIEGATGIIMLGWSTAFLVSLLARLKLLAHDWLSTDRPNG